MSERGRTALGAALVLLLVVAALSPALARGQLLGPGGGSIVHFPLRVAVFEAWAGGKLPAWNGGSLLGTPLLASYRPGALHPLMAALSILPPWLGFQSLVLGCIGLSTALTLVYARALGASTPGALAGGLFFGLGPTMLERLGDTPAVVAAPHLPLALLATERLLHGGGRWWIAALAAALGGLVLSGSPDMAVAGLLCVGLRLGIAVVQTRRLLRSPLVPVVLATAAGVFLAAPQWIPTLLAWPDSSGLANLGETGSGTGVVEWLVRQVSHSPAAALWIAGIPLVGGSRALRVFMGVAGLCAVVVGLGGFGGMSAPLLVLDFALAVGGALALSLLLAHRGEPLGRRARTWYLLACLASAIALSVATSTLGPLSQTLAGAVGALAVAQIVFFVWGGDERPTVAFLFLLPLSLAFALQPSGRGAWASGLRQEAWEAGSATRDAITRVIAWRTGERFATVSPSWPERDVLDLGFGNLGLLVGRREIGGIGWCVPRSRVAATGIDPASGLAGSALVSGEPGRLAFLGVRFLQVPVPQLGAFGHEEDEAARVDIEIRPDRPRLVPFPISVASAVRLQSALSDAVSVTAGTTVAVLSVRLASGRTLELPVRAGIETGEWARSRPDIRGKVRHPAPSAARTIPDRYGTGERYSVRLALPGRYGSVDAIGITTVQGTGRLSVFRLGLEDEARGLTVWATRLAGFVSDTHAVREAAATPFVRFFEVRGSVGRGRVVSSIFRASDEAGVRDLLGAPVAFGIDPRRSAVALASEVSDIFLPEDSRSGTAEVTYRTPQSIDARAQGPGLLVVPEGWAPGWSGRVDGRPVRIVRVNGGMMAVPIDVGLHHLELHYSVPGLDLGLGVAALGVCLLGFAFIRQPASRLTLREGTC